MNDTLIEMHPSDLGSRTQESGDNLKGKLDTQWVNEHLEHNKQQRRHKTWIFYSLLFICVAMLACFLFLVGFSERTLALLEKSPFAIILVTLMGGIPAILLGVIFKGVFHVQGKDDDFISKKDLETFKELIGMCKDIGGG